jgi:hypothetical protein
MPSEIIMYGPESLPYALSTDMGNKNNNVTASMPVAGVTGAPQGPYPLGTQLVLRDGRKFRYASVGATTLVVGTLIQASISLTTDQNMSAAASTVVNPYTGVATTNGLLGAAIGLTHGAATVIANFFAEGFIGVSVSPGGGDVYKIASHVALSSGANATIPDVVNLWPGHKIRRALTDTTSKLDLLSHPYSRNLIMPATLPTGVITGVAITPLTGAAGRGNFGFLQTRGIAGVLMDNTTGVVGQPAIASTVTAGAVSLVTTTNIITSPIVGQFVKVSASTAFSYVNLTLDG